MLQYAAKTEAIRAHAITRGPGRTPHLSLLREEEPTNQVHAPCRLAKLHKPPWPYGGNNNVRALSRRLTEILPEVPDLKVASQTERTPGRTPRKGEAGAAAHLCRGLRRIASPPPPRTLPSYGAVPASARASIHMPAAAPIGNPSPLPGCLFLDFAPNREETDRAFPHQTPIMPARAAWPIRSRVASAPVPCC